MPSCYKYLYNNIFIILILYYLITIIALIINTLIILTILISLSWYLFTNSFTSDLSDKNTEIVFFFKYNIFIVFTDLDTPFRRLISMFNSNIRSFSGILSISSYLININRLDIFILFISFFYSPSFLLNRNLLTFI